MSGHRRIELRMRMDERRPILYHDKGFDTLYRLESLTMQLVTYIRVGAVLHVNTVFYLLLVKPFLDIGLAGFEQGLLLPGIWWSWLSSFFLANAVLSQLDARSRWQNYKQIKDQLYGYGYRERIFKPVLKSSCQRQAALIAASEFGYRQQVQVVFRSHGYRWYHIPPDFVISHPQFLLSRHFWRTTFFAPTYHPRYRAQGKTTNVLRKRAIECPAIGGVRSQE